MQKWHQLEISVKANLVDFVEEYLFNNQVGAVTRVYDCDDLVIITALYEYKIDIDLIIANFNNQFATILVSEIKYKVIKDQQWQAACLYDYEPVKIGKKIIVYPNWHKIPDDDKHIYIIVDPSIAFGCGNHETTKMCLEWLEDNVTEKSQILDYGCGTGILSIGAVKLGAKYAEGIDIDINSISSSKQNAQLNEVSRKTNFTDKTPSQEFDLVVANIFSNVLISLVKNITSSLKKGGRLALSGIIENQVATVQEEFSKYGIDFSQPRKMGQWFLLDGVKNVL